MGNAPWRRHTPAISPCERPESEIRSCLVPARVQMRPFSRRRGEFIADRERRFRFPRLLFRTDAGPWLRIWLKDVLLSARITQKAQARRMNLTIEARARKLCRAPWVN
jgi:hypothetical protein